MKLALLRKNDLILKLVGLLRVELGAKLIGFRSYKIFKKKFLCADGDEN